MDNTRKNTGFARKNPPVLVVDYDFFVTSPKLQKWVRSHQKSATLVCLVATPNVEDPDDGDPTILHAEWDVIIRNTAGNPDEKFKFDALQSLANLSNLSPAVAVDLFNHECYYAFGVVHVLDGEEFG